MKTEHTPLPWKTAVECEGDRGEFAIVSHDAPDLCIASFRSGSDEERQANARLAVKAIRNHDRLVFALRNLANGGPNAGKNARALLAEIDAAE